MQSSVLRRQYHNLLGEPICLDIHRFTNCCQLMITKTNRRMDSLQWLALTIVLVSIVFSSNVNKILDRLVILSMTIVLMIALVYWRTPVYKESIVLLDNVSGLELTQHYSLFGKCWKRSQFILSSTIIINEAITMCWKRSQFILSSTIIINEAITMHRVIYYLVSIPLSLSTILLSDNSNDSKTKSQTESVRQCVGS
ncbi:unnamed protein product [Oppiella nova]|uniref:GPI-GlcNAc transferase complex PIG-H component conserved domain-containing protein n=1 Tax=Oppiella nova TaxID=334625 RepID=A0A7R9LD60_9ACAR|nr:unnamed protein product [Oppiella nova]CAG2162379.1 unnamed protein product [Oppiella nova]